MHDTLTHPPTYTHTHTLFFWLTSNLKHSINYNKTKFLKQQNVKIETLNRPQHIDYRQHLWNNIKSRHTHRHTHTHSHTHICRCYSTTNNQDIHSEISWQKAIDRYSIIKTKLILTTTHIKRDSYCNGNVKNSSEKQPEQKKFKSWIKHTHTHTRARARAQIG